MKMRFNMFLSCSFNLLCSVLLCSCFASIAEDHPFFTPDSNIIIYQLPGTLKPTLDKSRTPNPTETPLVTDCPNQWGFPDSEIVYSPTTINFSTTQYLSITDGLLSSYEQYLMVSGWTSSADIVQRVAIENSINPKLLLALIEYQCGAVFDYPDNTDTFNTALGFDEYYRKDLYGQLVQTANILSNGFYGWQNGTLKDISFPNGSQISPHPNSNAGSIAIQYFFAQFHSGESWENDLNQETGFPALYSLMFDDDWVNSASNELLIPPDLSQPKLSLPFEPGKTWALTGGPHAPFHGIGPMAALDFSPPSSEAGCQPSNEWVTAVANGLIMRSADGAVVQDLDGDGYEQTGWSILYFHIDDRDRVHDGTFVHTGDYIGHPSCEGGRSTGTHLHIARKYNGVWISADSDTPFVLDGWRAISGDSPYMGSLIKDGIIVVANQFGPEISCITKDAE